MSIAGAQEFRIGDVISQSWQTTIRNIIPFGVLAIVAAVIMVVLFFIIGAIFGISMPMSTTMMEPGAEMPKIGAGFVVGIIVAGLLIFAVYMGVMAAITYGTVQDLRGQSIGVGGLLQSAVSLVGPVLSTLIALLGVFLAAMIAAVVLNFIPILGMIASLVLFVFLYVIFWVVIPVAVVERPGPIASLKRSTDLTKGNRWRILGIILILVVISFGINIIGFVLMFLGPAIGGILQGLLSALVGIFSAVLIAVGYYKLRVAKEGVDIGEIAKVFD